MNIEILRFWRSLISNPKETGAVLPASRYLGEAMVQEVLFEPPGLVIELGGGTGSITQKLVDARSRFFGLVVFEQAQALASHLMRKFPEISIFPLCASRVQDLDLSGHRHVTIVSSLPFRSLPLNSRQILIDAISKVGSSVPCFRLIQYSYCECEPFPSPSSQFRWRRRKKIILNIPPATVWILERHPDAVEFKGGLESEVRKPSDSLKG